MGVSGMVGVAQEPVMLPQPAHISVPAPTVAAINSTSLHVKVLTYNLFWWNLYMKRHGNGGSASHLIRQAGTAQPFDVIGFQECVDGPRVLREAGLLADYDVIMFGRATMTNDLCMAFRKSAWSMLANGQAFVAEDLRSSYYGKRSAQWMRLRHNAAGKTLFFMNHHGPLPLNSGGMHGGAAVATNVLEQIKVHRQPGDAVILVGDFNAAASSATVQILEKHLSRIFTGNVDGGIDHIFSNLDHAALVSTTNLGNGGSDHDALSAIVDLQHPL